MKAICEGRMDHREFVSQSLDQYRAVFARTVRNMNVIQDVSAAPVLHRKIHQVKLTYTTVGSSIHSRAECR